MQCASVIYSGLVWSACPHFHSGKRAHQRRHFNAGILLWTPRRLDAQRIFRQCDRPQAHRKPQRIRHADGGWSSGSAEVKCTLCRQVVVTALGAPENPNWSTKEKLRSLRSLNTRHAEEAQFHARHGVSTLVKSSFLEDGEAATWILTSQKQWPRAGECGGREARAGELNWNSQEKGPKADAHSRPTSGKYNALTWTGVLARTDTHTHFPSEARWACSAAILPSRAVRISTAPSICVRSVICSSKPSIRLEFGDRRHGTVGGDLHLHSRVTIGPTAPTVTVIMRMTAVCN